AAYLRSVVDLGRAHSRTQSLGAAAVLAAMGVAMSGSRAALLATIIAASSAWLLGVRSPAGGRAGLRRIVLALAAFGTLLALVFPRLAARFIPLTTSTGLDVKLDISRRALRLIPEAPWLGSGRGSAVDLLSQVGLVDGARITSHIESAPVTFIVEWGVVVGGGLCFAALALVGLAIRSDTDPARRLASCGVMAYAI